MKDKIIVQKERSYYSPIHYSPFPRVHVSPNGRFIELFIILSSNYSVELCRRRVRVDRIMKDKRILGAERRVPIILPSIILPPLASTSQPQRATQRFTGPPEVLIILSTNYSVELR